MTFWTGWPFNEPWIMRELRKCGFAVVNAASLRPAEVYDACGIPWRDRALRAEAHLTDAVAAHEAIMNDKHFRFSPIELADYLDKVRAAWEAHYAINRAFEG